MKFQPVKHDVQMTDTEPKQNISLTATLIILSGASEDACENPCWHGKSSNSF
jgi:hypothetical protein